MTSHHFHRSVALVGAGYWGKNLARNLENLGALHTICDVDQTLLDTYKEQYPEVQLSTQLEDVLKIPEVSSVIIAAPALLHYRIARQVLEAGKDVYVEKPLCLETSEGEELIRLADEKGLILMVGHILQYHPCVQRLQELLGRGELGKLQYVVSNRLNLGSIRTEENALWNFAPHDVSLILSLFGQRLPDQVRCVGSAFISKGVADVSMTTMRFAGNVRAHIYVSWLNPFKEVKLVVVGSAGLAVFDDTKPWAEKLTLYRNHVRWSDGHIPLVDDSDCEFVQVEEKEPLREEVAHFLTCCRDRLKPLTDGQEALRVLKVLQAAQYSINEEGRAYNPQMFGNAAVMSEGGFVHPMALVDPGARIGNGSHIGPFCHVRAGASIGEGCELSERVSISRDVQIGRSVRFGHGVVCHDDVVVGDGSEIDSGAILGYKPNSASTDVATHIGERVKIGPNVSIAQGVRIGDDAIILGGSHICEDVPTRATISSATPTTKEQPSATV